MSDDEELKEQDSPGMTGRVVFVGVGASSADTLTVAGLHALRDADLLVTTGDLRAVLEDAEVEMPTVDDTFLLADLDDLVAFECERAAQGKTVVRLVGGDPLLEAGIAAEAQACAQSGCAIDIIPSVPTLTATATLAGVRLSELPVQLFAVPADADAIDVPALGSVIVGCRRSQVSAVAKAALDSGRPEDQHVLVTTGGGSLHQHSRVATLAEFAVSEAPADEDLEAERVLLVIGAAADRSEELDWYETKPLFGWCVLIPRTRADCTPLIERLRLHGATSELVPTISVEPPRNPQQLDKAVRGMVDGHYEWVIFTSGNAVRAVFNKLSEYGLDSRALSGLRIATVGADTARALRSWGIVPDLSPRGVQTVAGLAAEFPAYDDVLDPINKVFVPRADIATEPLATGLTQLGWDVDDVTAYRTVRASPPPPDTRDAIKSGRFDAVVFTSSTTVRNLVGIAGKPHAQTLVAVIGPATAEACEEHGLHVDAIAAHPNLLEVADVLAQAAKRRRDELIAAGQPVTKPSARKRRRGSR
ncbi:uroporphyrinogen-III synthase [Propionibacterium sp.]|uniref:uroporphyrinogen-III synthase n=1 Tax=Propionibacterium sp. TaxID=1977903 RepID=UPI0039EA270F